MTKKTGLTFEQHQMVGRRLREIFNEMARMHVLIGNAYPLNLSEPHISRVRGGLRRLRSNLEDAMFREHPDKATTKVYYGAPEDSLAGVWISAAERQPPDAWPRPCVVQAGITEQFWLTCRWSGGQWWVRDQLGDVMLTQRVLFWMEIYPLPDGTTPPAWAAIQPVSGEVADEA